LIQKKKGIYNFEIKGKIVPSPVIEYCECPSCGEVFFDQKTNKIIDDALLDDKKRKLEKVS